MSFLGALVLGHTEAWTFGIMVMLGVGYYFLGRRIAAYLSARVVVLVVPYSGDVVEVTGRISGEKLHYAYAGQKHTSALGPGVVRPLRRRLKKRNVVFMNGVTGVPLYFPPDESTPRHLWSDRVAAMAKTLGEIALRRAKSGPFGELAPYIPMMILLLLAMVGAILFGTGKGQGWW